MNNALTVLLVDDEPLATERLSVLLAEMPHCRVVGQANNAEQAWALCNSLRPDLLLLDISMPGETGLQLAARIGALASPPAIVFCTAYAEHALQAFDAQAIDYLLKPVRRERLMESIERVLRLKQNKAHDAQRLFIAATIGGMPRRIALTDILYLHADEKYTVAYHRGGEHILDQSLKELEQQFPSQFVRIHRNCLVNHEQLLALRRDAEGQIWAVLKDVQEPMEVSRRCASDLKGWLKNS